MRITRRRERPDGALPPSFDLVVGAAKTGDGEAISVLYLNHVAMVYGYLRACGAPEPDDLTSEVFVGMLRALAKFDGDQPEFRRWLMTIAHRRLVDSRRRQSRNRSDLSEPFSLEAMRATAANELQPVEIDAQLIEAFDGLTDAQREVLALRFIADVSVQGVARITGRPTSAIKSLQNRGLASLRRQIPVPRIRQDA